MACQLYHQWVEHTIGDAATQSELAAIAGDYDEIKDRYWRDLAFGTGGMRGVMGAGTNRINAYTVNRATQGLAAYVLDSKRRMLGDDVCQEPLSVCVAYDTRNDSQALALSASCVLCANGIRARIFSAPRPTPMLSFAVRHLGASAGIVITASHNPKEYNGYKVYGSDGGQITDKAAEQVFALIRECDMFDGVYTMEPSRAREAGLLRDIGEDVESAYYCMVSALIMRKHLVQKEAACLGVLFTPLNGTGSIPVRHILKSLGFTNLAVVPEQEAPNGNFPTTPHPNPECLDVFSLALEMAKQKNPAPDLILATDPDCDRIGVMCATCSDGYRMLTGNQVGALLCDYILSTRSELGTLPYGATVVKTIVTTELAKEICMEYSASAIDVLTGFKYIGEQAGALGERFVFGFEESNGYLAGDAVRDKDGVIAATLICEMALYHKARGSSLPEALEALDARHGCYRERLLPLDFPGEQGQRWIAAIMSGLRANCCRMVASDGIKRIEDFMVESAPSKNSLLLPCADVIKLVFEDKSWIVFRPSGTEPKLKIYIGVGHACMGETEAADRLALLEAMALEFVNEGKYADKYTIC